MWLPNIPTAGTGTRRLKRRGLNRRRRVLGHALAGHCKRKRAHPDNGYSVQRSGGFVIRTLFTTSYSEPNPVWRTWRLSDEARLITTLPFAATIPLWALNRKVHSTPVHLALKSCTLWLNEVTVLRRPDLEAYETCGCSRLCLAREDSAPTTFFPLEPTALSRPNCETRSPAT
jgi:hypothetical protein